MYDFKKIEQKWQKFYSDSKVFEVSLDSNKPKYYVLTEFPYPSGEGLHVGHPRGYTAMDVVARKKRMDGFNVLFPMGWDAFGLPAENYAIKNKIHPKEAVKRNIKIFKDQLLKLGLSYDWSREISTTDPKYYKWTQWQFLKFYEHGMAYKAKTPINFCPNCKVGLSNEDSAGGKCDRCDSDVIQVEKEQWMLKMKSYADKLLDGLKETKFLDRIKLGQKNWIGKSSGANIDFELSIKDEKITVFTTRVDTIYGVTFLVMAPEHPLIKKYKHLISNYDEVSLYIETSKNKTEFERVNMTKDKTGVKIEGITALNPVSGEILPIFLSDYVVMGYGSGAVMAVPAHDQRDFEFATKFNLPIICVIDNENSENLEFSYTGDGIMINSGILNGIDNKKDSIAKMTEYIESKKIGQKVKQYRLQDWVFSRQRFWGEPIPMIQCDCCGWVPVPESNLPVKLPEVTSYEQTNTGESPLAIIEDWVNCKCPKCGKDAKRETDTMPNWAGSSWYYLRYMDPQNDTEFVSKKALEYFNQVDLYNGGMEHVTRHLLYARFWHRFFYDIGYIPYSEPFKKRIANGLILAQDGGKMSKSKGNTINPNQIIEEFGADALRLYELFISDYESDASWNTNGLKGCKKFLDRIFRLKEKVINDSNYSKSLEVEINKTIKKVLNDIENLKFNTAIAALMTLLNVYEKCESITKGDYKVILTLLNPFAPHITEELNEICNLGKKLVYCSYPIYDENKIESYEFELIIQINGKLRAKEKVNNNITKEEILEMIHKFPNIEKYLEGSTIVNTIYVPKKLINIVIK